MHNIMLVFIILYYQRITLSILTATIMVWNNKLLISSVIAYFGLFFLQYFEYKSLKYAFRIVADMIWQFKLKRALRCKSLIPVFPTNCCCISLLSWNMNFITFPIFFIVLLPNFGTEKITKTCKVENVVADRVYYHIKVLYWGQKMQCIYHTSYCCKYTDD